MTVVYVVPAGGWFGHHGQTFAAWWQRMTDSPEAMGHLRDKLREIASRHPEAMRVSMRHPDGSYFMGIVRG